jgi:uncharacterized repeat protein (TIGR01451 family)
MKALIKYIVFHSIFIVLVSATSAQAEKASGIQLNMTVEKEVKTTDLKGQTIIKRLEPVNIIPGDKVVYTTQYHNTSTQNIHNVLITNPIPKGLFYLKGSAKQPKTTVTYSVDGGKTFNLPPQLKMTQKEGKQRPALVQDYTHIRWKIQSISANEKGTVHFKARLK